MVLKYQLVIRELKELFVKEFKDKIDSIVLFGSATKGRYREGESDIDILIVAEDDSLYDKILDIVIEVDLEYNTATSLVYLTKEKFDKYLKWGSPFLENVIEEGVVLYDNGTFKRTRKSIVKASK